MGFQIDDGTGTGNRAKVTSAYRLLTSTVTKTEDHDINESTGKVWSLPFDGLNPTASGDYVFYLKNTGDSVLEISDIRVMADTSPTQLEVNVVSGTAAGGTDITPISRTVGSSVIPTATIQKGSDITGLTSAGTIFFIQCPTVDQQEKLSTSSKIRIPKGKAIGLLVETGEANITGVVSLIEEQ